MFVLYFKPSCPFCQRVLQIAENLNVTFELKDISDDETALAALIEKGGKQQVPYLVDTQKDVAMYESSDIIDYIRDNRSVDEGTTAEMTKPKLHISNSVCESCEG